MPLFSNYQVQNRNFDDPSLGVFCWQRCSDFSINAAHVKQFLCFFWRNSIFMDTPFLPVELERKIFELSASIHPECALTLVRVARRLRIWIKPLLYRTFTIDLRTPRPEFPRLSLGAISKLVALDPQAVRDHTRHVCFVELSKVDGPVIIDFLSRCAVVVDLAFMSAGPRFEEPHPDAFAALSLRRLSVSRLSLSMLGRAVFAGHSIFSRLTHLDILDFGDCNHYGGPQTVLQRMPCLTHLSTAPGPKSLSDSALRQVMVVCEKLEVLVFRYPTQQDLDEDRARTQITDDPRFVMLVVPDRVLDWELGTQGGEDYWAVASALAMRRNRVEGE
ncbi:hypothetical protein MSAN_01048700 [Mycena sanguinolenta]|uniref:F-box domain-containing protein n=1 Tax=Mycena sanguinolenta TaxID=230812 RepID=A0A8H6YT91_9AGAR|nr:hypothetical protein MSAN_01048700 [Mycena sanguinolenta]